VLATIAAKVYRGRRDPLGAYRLVNQLLGSLKQVASAEVWLAIESLTAGSSVNAGLICFKRPAG
jgi:hypothetical protein